MTNSYIKIYFKAFNLTRHLFIDLDIFSFENLIQIEEVSVFENDNIVNIYLWTSIDQYLRIDRLHI